MHDKVKTLRFEHYHVDRKISKLEDNLEQLTAELALFNQHQAERATQTNFITGHTHMQTLFGGGPGLYK